MSELVKLQAEFAVHVAHLILEANSLQLVVTLGDAFRDPRVHGPQGVKVGYGEGRSAHKNRLAIDINLFKGGKLLQTTQDHRVLGEWWEKQHPRARWGGRWNDGNHYSFEWNGIA